MPSNIRNTNISTPNIDRHIIRNDANIATALEALNRLSGSIMTLFVVDYNYRIVGSLTDGDIRRGLIAGASVNDSVQRVMHRNFKVIHPDCDCFEQISIAKKANIQMLPLVDADMHIIEIIDLNYIRNLLPLDAVLMAGGKGERLRPLTLSTPKPLLKIGDKAIIDHNLDHLAEYGIKNIFITVNYLHEQIEAHAANRPGTQNITCIKEPKPLGTLGAVGLIDNFSHKNVIIMNSDILTDISFEDMYAQHLSRNADLTMAVIPYTVSVPFAIIDTHNDKVNSIIEKPSYNYFANAGIYIVASRLLKNINPDKHLDAPDFIKSLIDNGANVAYFPINGTWVDIGSPDDFRYANDLMNRPNNSF